MRGLSVITTLRLAGDQGQPASTQLRHGGYPPGIGRRSANRALQQDARCPWGWAADARWPGRPDAGADGRLSVVMLLEQGPQPEPLVLERQQVCAVE